MIINRIDINDINTCNTNTDRFTYRFTKNKSIKRVEIILNMESAKSLIRMFNECRNLEYLNLTFPNYKNINISNIFAYCESLKYLIINNINTIYSDVIFDTYMFSYAFCKCKSLKYLNISNLQNTYSFEYNQNMFSLCEMKYLNISNFRIRCNYFTRRGLSKILLIKCMYSKYLKSNYYFIPILRLNIRTSF